jgi:hypothetical protein
MNNESAGLTQFLIVILIFLLIPLFYMIITVAGQIGQIMWRQASPADGKGGSFDARPTERMTRPQERRGLLRKRLTTLIPPRFVNSLTSASRL